MICPNCGNNIADGSTNCFMCGSPLANNSNNVQPTPQMPVNNGNDGIFVPQDFKLAGDSDDLENDLPDAMANVLNKKDDEEKEKKPKKKRKKGFIKKIIKFIFTLAILGGIAYVGYNLYLGYTSPKYEMKCTIKTNQELYTVEMEREFSMSEHGFVNSFEKMTISNNNTMPMTRTDLDAQMTNMGNFGYDLYGTLEDGKIVITYYTSYYDMKSITNIVNESTKAGYICEKAEVKGIVLPFFK